MLCIQPGAGGEDGRQAGQTDIDVFAAALDQAVGIQNEGVATLVRESDL